MEIKSTDETIVARENRHVFSAEVRWKFAPRDTTVLSTFQFQVSFKRKIKTKVPGYQEFCFIPLFPDMIPIFVVLITFNFLMQSSLSLVFHNGLISF